MIKMIVQPKPIVWLTKLDVKFINNKTVGIIVVDLLAFFKGFVFLKSLGEDYYSTHLHTQKDHSRIIKKLDYSQ